MKNAIQVLSDEERQRLSDRIASLEERTDAEVVCAVATESGRYDRAESVCGLTLGVLASIVAQLVYSIDHWDVNLALPIGWQVGLIAVGFVAGTSLSSYWYGLRRLLVTEKEMETEVQRSLHAVYSRCGIGETRQHGGLLIYLTLFEHRLEVHGNRLLLEKVTVAELESIRDAVLEKVRIGQVAAGILAGLDVADAVLTKTLPHSGDATDARSNDILVFHPRP